MRCNLAQKQTDTRTGLPTENARATVQAERGISQRRAGEMTPPDELARAGRLSGTVRWHGMDWRSVGVSARLEQLL
jgi:hypothetical protein